MEKGFKKVACDILGITQRSYSNYVAQNRPVIKLLEKYFLKEDLEEFLKEERISKLEESSLCTDTMYNNLLNYQNFFNIIKQGEVLFRIQSLRELKNSVYFKYFDFVLKNKEYISEWLSDASFNGRLINSLLTNTNLNEEYLSNDFFKTIANLDTNLILTINYLSYNDFEKYHTFYEVNPNPQEVLDHKVLFYCYDLFKDIDDEDKFNTLIEQIRNKLIENRHYILNNRSAIISGKLKAPEIKF